ncbi:MAG: MBOAT family protein [Candidatus Electrothrix aestuarii]|uniref:MBOAT family protein n=1 Tax=Candidatus Electrothrix aestuarii TaxID=3062594 RepID=A0AAU8M0U8_9BACT|nr:MBOAT family protein [Candidatus Electrothrix aestuarii]
MVFSSITFLFFFLPVVLLGYLCVGKRGRNLFLLLASLFFYLWGEQLFVLVMLASIIMNYLFGLLLDRAEMQGSRAGKFLLAAALVANLGMLGFFKYANFAVDNLNLLFSWVSVPRIPLNEVHLPIGISFFTFQAMSYLIDLYRQEYKAQKNPLYLGLYISLFPQLIAGPIVRYRDIAEHIKKRTVSLHDFACGAERFIFGLGKKVLIANPMGQMADHIFGMQAAQLSTGTAWLGVICYTLQIYFDFSGYSEMAIGLGRMFGFHFLENFNYPYISRSIREFWRRWHISLSTWFRDYLYIPLGGNRHGNKRTSLNLLIVFLLCGLWHGASWNFILWGLMYGFFLVVERGKWGRILAGIHPLGQHCYTLLVVINGWVFFRLEQLAEAGSYFSVMYGFAGAERMHPRISMECNALFLSSFVAGILLSLPLYPWLRGQWRIWTREHAPAAVFVQSAKLVLISTLLLFSAGLISVGAYNPFIYFRF